jgi:RNA-directed DNA polymerase
MTCCSSRLVSWLTRTVRGRRLVLRRGIGASVTGPLRIARPTRQQRCSREAVAIVRAQPIPRDRYRQVKRKFCTIVGGVISPLLANRYMNRFLRHWRQQGCGEAFQAHVVAYADDFVILSRGYADEALAWTRQVMNRLGLTVNEAKTTVRDARQEHFDFLGYSFGPHYYRKDGHWYLGASPSKKSVQRLKEHVRGIMVPANTAPWEEVRDRLNHLLRGWANYFSYGTRLMAYRAADHNVYEAVRGFLTRRHKVPTRGTRRFSDHVVFEKLGVLRLRRMHIGAPPIAAR